MPYADVTTRRTYHASYMQGWRARQGQQTPPPLPAAAALVDAAQRIATAAQTLQRQAAASSTVPAMLLTLREGTRVLVEVTALLVQLTSSAPPPAPR